MDLSTALNAVPGAADSLLNVLRTQGADVYPLALKQVIASAKIQITFGWIFAGLAGGIILGSIFAAIVEEIECLLFGLFAILPAIPATILLCDGYRMLAAPEWYALEKVRSLLP